MRKQIAVMAAFAVVIVLVASTAIAGHGSLPWVSGSGVHIVLVPGIEGPEQLAPDEPFHIRHGWAELDVAKEQQQKDFSFTVRAITGEDVNNQFVVGTFLEPTLTNCDPATGDRDCKLFLFDFPGGLQAVPGYDGGPVRFVADWYGPCGQLAANANNAECTLDEDQVVAVLHGELTITPEE